MLSWFRRTRLIVPVGAVALVAAGCVDFTGTKVITGDGTPTGDFVVRITCQIGDNVVTQDVTFQGEETVSGDAILLGPLEGEASCFITEIEQAGATSVTYECGDIEIDLTEMVPDLGVENTGGGPGMSASRGEAEEATCTETPDGLQVEIALSEPAEIDIDYTVINDFAVTPTTTTATTAPPEPAPVEAVAPAPVPAQVVTFTG